jgi:hypothetical protein
MKSRRPAIARLIKERICDKPVVIAGLLAGITLVLYWPITGHEFINFDDHEYITDNPHVRTGLTW